MIRVASGEKQPHRVGEHATLVVLLCGTSIHMVACYSPERELREQFIELRTNPLYDCDGDGPEETDLEECILSVSSHCTSQDISARMSELDCSVKHDCADSSGYIDCLKQYDVRSECYDGGSGLVGSP